MCIYFLFLLGADEIEYANEEVRRMAEAQKRDLESIAIPSDNMNDDNGNENNNKSNNKNNKTIGRKIKNMMQKRRTKNNNSNSKSPDDDENKEPRRIHVKDASQMSQILNGSSDFDSDLHCALVRSSNETSELDRVCAASLEEAKCNKKKMQEEEDLAVATALSLSLKDSRKKCTLFREP